MSTAVPPQGDSPRPAPSLRRRILFRFLALLLGLLLAMLGAEIFVRLDLAYQFRGRIDQMSREAPIYSSGYAPLGELVTPVSDPDIVYRLKPNIRSGFADVPVHTNSLGFVGDEFDAKKQPGTYRVMILGDSNSWGWGVMQEKCYVQILQKSFRRVAGSDQQIEFINTSVPGYNAAMEAAIFLRHVDEFDPDLVIIQYCLNDNVVSAFLQDYGYTSRFNHLFLFDQDAISNVFNGINAKLDLTLVEAPFDEFELQPLEQDPGSLPGAYRHLVGPKATAAAYDRLARACRERGIPLYCLLPTPLVFEQRPDLKRDPRYAEIRSICAKNQIPIIDPFLRTRRFVLERNLTSFDLAFRVPDDFHPNPARHVLMAQGALEALAPELAKIGGTPEAVALELARLDFLLSDRADEIYPLFRDRVVHDARCQHRWNQYIQMQKLLQSDLPGKSDERVPP